MIRLYEILAIGGFTFLSFIGVVIVRGGKKLAFVVAVMVSVALLIWDAKLEDETGKGIAGNLYCLVVQCRPPITGPTPVNPATGQPVSPETAMMTGVFGSDYGPVELSSQGGRYRDRNGTLTIEQISGSVVEGRWQQTGGGFFAIVCTDGRNRGRFRFDFNQHGFLGRWSQCDGPFDETWDGWRPKTMQFRNLCGQAVDLYLRWTDENVVWRASGPWTINANAARLLEVSGPSGATPIRTSSWQIFARVVERASGRVIFEGTDQVDVNGTRMGMQQVQTTAAGQGFEIAMDCDGASGTDGVVS